MSTLAIQGEKIRGNEIIKILESLGGKNTHNYKGDCKEAYYYLNNKNIICFGFINPLNEKEYIEYNLDTFNKKFPFKEGDAVVFKVFHETHTDTIEKMYWDDIDDEIIYSFKNVTVLRKAHQLSFITLQSNKNTEAIKKNKLSINDDEYEDNIELILNDRKLIINNGQIFIIKE